MDSLNALDWQHGQANSRRPRRPPDTCFETFLLTDGFYDDSEHRIRCCVSVRDKSSLLKICLLRRRGPRSNQTQARPVRHFNVGLQPAWGLICARAVRSEKRLIRALNGEGKAETASKKVTACSITAGATYGFSSPISEVKSAQLSSWLELGSTRMFNLTSQR